LQEQTQVDNSEIKDMLRDAKPLKVHAHCIFIFICQFSSFFEEKKSGSFSSGSLVFRFLFKNQKKEERERETERKIKEKEKKKMVFQLSLPYLFFCLFFGLSLKTSSSPVSTVVFSFSLYFPPFPLTSSFIFLDLVKAQWLLFCKSFILGYF
jgi:hypothetical protein